MARNLGQGRPPPAFTETQMRVVFHKRAEAPKEMWIFGSDEQSRDHDRLDKSSDLVRWHDLSPEDTVQEIRCEFEPARYLPL